jgi:hypothetical protein
VPVLAGALTTAALHGLAVQHHILWYVFATCCGCSGIPVGFVPAALAVRRDPWMGAGAGFAVAFLATGLGAIAVAAVTVLRGFEVPKEQIETVREAMLKQPDVNKDDVQHMLDLLLSAGPLFTVFAAALIALTGGITGAVVAAVASRRRPWSPPAPR